MASELEKILDEIPEKKDRFKFYKDFISDKEKMKNVRTIIMWSIPFVMAIIYWSFLDNFNWNGADWTTIGALGLIASIGIASSKNDSTSRSKDDAITFDDDLKLVEKTIYEMEFPLERDDDILSILEIYNNDLQERANKIKTQERIRDLRLQRRIEMQKGNSTKKIDTELEYLKDNNLIETNIVLFSYNDIVLQNNDKKNKSKLVDARTIRYDSSNYNKINSFLWSSLKGIALGGIGIGVSWSAGFWVVVSFVLSLLFSMSVTYLLTYILVRHRTLGPYFEGRKEKLKLMRYVEGKLKEVKDEVPMEN